MPSMPQFPPLQDEQGSAVMGGEGAGGSAGEGMGPVPMEMSSPHRNAPTPAAMLTTARSRRGPSVPMATAATAVR